ncbi:hypothetical protein [Thiothrix nivea]|uniref:hypothetical protein n=1 Tax=Thiothrix nivea TaxID=1031 RepID=UPI0005940530|nr:hypothetical protein [Thiothrix nivea]
MRLLLNILFVILSCLTGVWQSSALAATLVAAEAFIDNPSKTAGTGTSLPLDEALSDPLRTAKGVVDISALAEGPHTLYVRFKDDKNDWSTPLAVGFFIAEGSVGGTLPSGNNRIVSAEAFIDTDPGKGKATPVATAKDGTIDGSSEILGGAIPLTGLDVGVHVLHTRTLDATGVWSQTFRQPFFVPVLQNGGSGNPVTLAAAEGILDSSTTVYLSATDGAFDNGVETTSWIASVTNGYHSATIRFKDQYGLWSGSGDIVFSF